MSKKIEVSTKFGTLIAETGNDPDFPEIVVYLSDGEGREIQLAVVGQTDSWKDVDNTWEHEEVLRIASWDTLEEDLSHCFVITKEDLDKPEAFWC